MATFYDIAGSMQQADPVGAYQRGLMWRQQMQELARVRKQHDYDEQTRQGLMQFWKQAQPERTEYVPKANPLAALASQPPQSGADELLARTGSVGLGLIPSTAAAKPADLSGQSTAGPMLERRTTPGTAANFDYKSAADYLAGRGAFDQMEGIAKLQAMSAPQSAKWLGVTKTDKEGNVWGANERGWERLPFQEQPEMPKAPNTREFHSGGKTLTQEWDSRSGRWETIATAPRVMDNPDRDRKDTIKAEMDLRKEFNGLTSTYREVSRARSNVSNSLRQNSAAGDLAAATAIMKMLDPGSVVRESELGMAMNATGALDRVGNYAQMLQNGQRLNPQQRAEFQALADSLFGTAEQSYKDTKEGYRALAGQYGLRAENIVGRDQPASGSGWGIKRLP
jgi:hypothetical protein